MKPKLLNDYPDKLLLGTNPDYGDIYLLKPEWDCDWYWGFGYIRSKDTQTHLKYLGDDTLFNNIKLFIPNIRMSDKNLWVFCEVVASIYTLREMSELVYRGGSHYTTNPCKELLQNQEWYEHINCTLIPKLIDEMYKLLMEYQ